MLKYLAKRIGRSILTLFIIVTLVFCLLRLMPVEGYFANYEKMTEAQIQAGLQSMGLLSPASSPRSCPFPSRWACTPCC